MNQVMSSIYEQGYDKYIWTRLWVVYMNKFMSSIYEQGYE